MDAGDFNRNHSLFFFSFFCFFRRRASVCYPDRYQNHFSVGSLLPNMLFNGTRETVPVRRILVWSRMENKGFDKLKISKI